MFPGLPAPNHSLLHSSRPPRPAACSLPCCFLCSRAHVRVCKHAAQVTVHISLWTASCLPCDFACTQCIPLVPSAARLFFWTALARARSGMEMQGLGRSLFRPPPCTRFAQATAVTRAFRARHRRAHAPKCDSCAHTHLCHRRFLYRTPPCSPLPPFSLSAHAPLHRSWRSASCLSLRCNASGGFRHPG